ncbi:MAG TPA: class I SAM-dependent methyltransferase [Candidatus Korarchaeota archaeon]|nr:class I SAM-dependent methyltransferase [Candidatus Korarchaeota archaeon]
MSHHIIKKRPSKFLKPSELSVVKKARPLYPLKALLSDRVRFKEGDARNISFPDNYFDIVVSSFAIHIIRKGREDALKEMIRVLKPGGKFAIVEPVKERWTGWVVDDKLKTKLQELGLKNVKFHPIIISYPKKR